MDPVIETRGGLIRAHENADAREAIPPASGAARPLLTNELPCAFPIAEVLPLDVIDADIPADTPHPLRDEYRAARQARHLAARALERAAPDAAETDPDGLEELHERLAEAQAVLHATCVRIRAHQDEQAEKADRVSYFTSRVTVVQHDLDRGPAAWRHALPVAAHLWCVLGRPARAVEALDHCVETRPPACELHVGLAEACLQLGDCKRAADEAQKAMSFGYAHPRDTLMRALLLQGAPRETILEAFADGVGVAKTTAVMLEHAFGSPERARKVLEEQVIPTWTGAVLDLHSALMIAEAYAFIGDKAKAHEWIGRNGRMKAGQDRIHSKFFAVLQDEPERWNRAFRRVLPDEVAGLALHVALPPPLPR